MLSVFVLDLRPQPLDEGETIIKDTSNDIQKKTAQPLPKKKSLRQDPLKSGRGCKQRISGGIKGADELDAFPIVRLVKALKAVGCRAKLTNPSRANCKRQEGPQA